MENRKQPRVPLPLEIDLRHPCIGTRTVVARDMNDEGVFAWYPDAPFRVGSTLQVALRCMPMIESRPTPTVKMQISRIDENGVFLTFSNKSGAHLWRSARLAPGELKIGRDLFRVFQAAIVRDSTGRIMTVQQNGRWLYPGTFLHAGEHWLQVLQDWLGECLNLTETQFMRTVLTHSDPKVVATEGSIMSVFHLFTLDASDSNAATTPPPETARLAKDAPYTQIRWLSSHRELDELSFSAEPLRELAHSVLKTGDQRHISKAARQTTTKPGGAARVQQKYG